MYNKESYFYGTGRRKSSVARVRLYQGTGKVTINDIDIDDYFGLETLSWLCILSAAPFAALGFISYNGMTAEKFIWVWLKSEVLIPKQIKFESNNYYWECIQPFLEEKRKEELKHD